MWSYILNKPNQGKDLSLFRVELMNVPEEYGDVVEWSNTHSVLLDENEWIK